MDIILLLKALLLGIVEGITEFLPISSTGHLIVSADLLNFHSTEKVFEIAIQLGAVLAVVYEYRQRFSHILTHVGRDAKVNRFVVNIAIAFIPAAVVGLLFSSKIKEFLFNPITVATALVVGGLIMFWAEHRQKTVQPRVLNVDDMTAKDALVVGCAQILALIPGTSRSGSTIIGGMFSGLERKVATEFSFFLAVPIMFAATGYQILKYRDLFSVDDIATIAVGFIAAFISGLFAVRALLKFLANHNYVPFAWYRVIFGGIILLTWATGMVEWTVP
ncbi:undecaprenyl-diphosphate phosphatase [Rheinheimera sp. D18]|uniref:undecaprenyl-diphosphate phosphatase n=1 Tax=Rheinheimera sp. D18 TaxID=2545632 RepID=UPI00104DA77C|nr:undecaprenyl-diphosphate phosphatase [Rheinheimera sp. D18]QBL08354.1 undecaprenyl-diphosphate phosphatase [Rheinheimera sp. D18]